MHNSICRYKKQVNKEENGMLEMVHIPKGCKKEETKELKTWGSHRKQIV